jgi:HSP20 family protein
MEDRNEFSFVPVDIKENSDMYVLSALVPGLKADDITISLEQEVLTVEGDLNYEREEDGTYLVSERPSGSFKRSFKLPRAIDAEKISAKLTDGILVVEIPKSESSQSRIIKVK